MLRVSCRHPRHFAVPITTLLFLASVVLPSVTAYGQSLDDVARENREKAEAATTASRKVITDADVPKGGQGSGAAGASSKAQTMSPAKTGASMTTATSRVDPRAAEQWRRQILEQKRTVATLEKRLARYQASVPYVDASAISRGEILNRRQAWEQERVAQVQEQLEEQRAKLLELQEEARRAGMHTQVYDP